METVWNVYVGPGMGYGTEDVQINEGLNISMLSMLGCVDPFCFRGVSVLDAWP